MSTISAKVACTASIEAVRRKFVRAINVVCKERQKVASRLEAIATRVVGGSLWALSWDWVPRFILDTMTPLIVSRESD